MSDQDNGGSVDLIGELRRIECRAARGMDALKHGKAVTGVNALQEIRWLAADAVRHATDDDSSGERT